MSGDESWRGHVNRAQLSGFARIRAILWRRSLRFWEAWTLGRHSWYWKLAWQTRRAFSGISFHEASRLEKDEDIFGETPLLTVVHLLKICRSLSPEPSSFVDLGSGNGTPCFAADRMGFDAIGMEKEAAWVAACSEVAAALKWDCRFVCGDFLEQKWPSPAVYFIVATALGPELKNQLNERFENLDKNSFLIWGGDSPPQCLQTAWQGRLPVDWGIIDFRILTSGTKAPQGEE